MKAAPQNGGIKIREILRRLEEFRYSELDTVHIALGLEPEVREDARRNALALSVAIDALEDLATESVLPFESEVDDVPGFVRTVLEKLQ